MIDVKGGAAELSVTADGIQTAVVGGAKVIFEEIKLVTLLEQNNLTPVRNMRRMIIDVDSATGQINLSGAWLFAERLTGSVIKGVEEDLFLVAGGRYQADDGDKVSPVIEVCGALGARDFRVRKAVKFSGRGSVVHGVELSDKELCSSLGALTGAVGNPLVYSKQIVEEVSAK